MSGHCARRLSRHDYAVACSRRGTLITALPIVTDVMAAQAPPELLGMHNMAGVLPPDVSTVLAQ